MVEELRVLLVEDDPTARAALHALLSHSLRHVRVVETTCGEDALVHLRGREHDVVISDYHMGSLDGISLLEIVRRDHPRVGRVLVTGHANFEVAREAINRAGVHAFLQKPVTAAALARAVESARERAAQEASV
jgi:DNA-binding NtrC family response regulator